MTKDGRLEHLETQPYLRGVKFVRKPYRAYRPDWDHDHCAACWMKLTEPDIEGDGIVHEGYASGPDYFKGADYEWVCIPCFQAFRGAMGWTEIDANSN